MTAELNSEVIFFLRSSLYFVSFCSHRVIVKQDTMYIYPEGGEAHV